MLAEIPQQRPRFRFKLPRGLDQKPGQLTRRGQPDSDKRPLTGLPGFALLHPTRDLLRRARIAALSDLAPQLHGVATAGLEAFDHIRQIRIEYALDELLSPAIRKLFSMGVLADGLAIQTEPACDLRERMPAFVEPSYASVSLQTLLTTCLGRSLLGARSWEGSPHRRPQRCRQTSRHRELLERCEVTKT